MPLHGLTQVVIQRVYSLIRPRQVLLADDLVGFQLRYLVLGQAKQVPEDVLVVLAQAVGGDADAQSVLENFQFMPGYRWVPASL